MSARLVSTLVLNPTMARVLYKDVVRLFPRTDKDHLEASQEILQKVIEENRHLSGDVCWDLRLTERIDGTADFYITIVDKKSPFYYDPLFITAFFLALCFFLLIV